MIEIDSVLLKSRIMTVIEASRNRTLHEALIRQRLNAIRLETPMYVGRTYREGVYCLYYTTGDTERTYLCCGDDE